MIYSVVIPAYNAAATIQEAVQSVLDQTIAPKEVIVIDDGSTDDTAQIAARMSPLIQVISQSNTGPGAATSAGMALAKNPFIAMLDADDIWLLNKSEVQFEAVKRRPNTSIFFTKQRQFRHGDPQRTRGELRDGLNRSSLLIRRAVFDTIGDVIDPIGGRGDMVDWLARANESGFQSHLIDEVLCLRRSIPSSLSYGRDAQKDRGFLEVAHRAMQRRKARQEQET